jgi:hypothetical protein
MKLRFAPRLTRVGYVATLEDDAVRHADTTADMAIELYCDTENARGIAFSQRQGFEIIEQVDAARPKSCGFQAFEVARWAPGDDSHAKTSSHTRERPAARIDDRGRLREDRDKTSATTSPMST